MGAALVLGFAPPPGELETSGLYCLTGTLRSCSGNRAGLKALDLPDPLLVAERDWRGRQLFLS